jgi:hypothetical protein
LAIPVSIDPWALSLSVAAALAIFGFNSNTYCMLRGWRRARVSLRERRLGAAISHRRLRRTW